jgi:DUF4097 and DUF4098 domain-containing protein YvlB
MTTKFFKTVAICAALCVLSSVALAQKDERSLSCDNNRRWNDDQANHCVMREQTIGSGGVINVDGRANGSVTVRGWNRADIFIRYQIQTWARTDLEAKELTDQVQVEINGTNIRSTGPSTQGRRGWAVSYEIFAPQRSDLSLRSTNGSVRVDDVRGRIEFDTTNGSVRLTRLAGSVRGTTTNGSLHVELDGQRWDGEGVDVRTTNGSVRVFVPANYSARLETRTVNGCLNFDFPVTVQGKIDRELNTDLGSGGPPIRVQTTNGGVSIRRQ